MSFEYVDFPAIGLRIPVSRTLFKVFGQDIYAYAVIIALSILLMIFLGLRHCERYGIQQDVIIDFMIFAMPASIICARLYYVAFSWDSYRGSLLDIINVRQGGLAIYGGVIGAFLTVVIFSKVRKLDTVRFFDFGVPYLILAQGIGRWGNFINQEVFGTNTTLPWGMTSSQISAYLASHEQWLATLGVTVDPFKPVHPTFLYESLWNIAVAFILFKLRKRMKYKGEVLLGYLIGYGVGRAFIEGLRTDSLMLGGFRVSQMLSVIIVAVCLIIVVFFRNRFPQYDMAPAAEAGVDGTGDDEDGESSGEAGAEDDKSDDGVNGEQGGATGDGDSDGDGDGDNDGGNGDDDGDGDSDGDGDGDNDGGNGDDDSGNGNDKQ